MSVEWRLMPTMRVAAFSHLNRDGHEIMVESDAKTKLCCHGETSSTIRNWVLAESKARAAGTPPPRNSVCDCQQTVGLQNHSCCAPAAAAPPCTTCSPPLRARSHRRRSGRARVPWVLDAYVAASGSIYCKHANELRTRRKATLLAQSTKRHVWCRLVSALHAAPQARSVRIGVRRGREEVLGKVVVRCSTFGVLELVCTFESYEYSNQTITLKLPGRTSH